MGKCNICAVAVVIVVAALTTCASRTYNTWLGANMDDLINSWGPPDRISTLPNGTKVASYTENVGRSRSIFPYKSSRTIYCDIEWWAGPDGIIDKLRWRGHRDSCNRILWKRGQGPKVQSEQWLTQANKF